jgi:hypothetical protein
VKIQVSVYSDAFEHLAIEEAGSVPSLFGTAYAYQQLF